MPIQIGYAHRQAPMARRGMVSSCHPLATLAGVEVLKAGGNVVDAAIATNGVLAVTQPNYCGVGGDLFCLYHEAATGRVHCLLGAGRSGSRASLDELRRRGLSAMPLVGAGSVSVPGVTRAWRMLLERFGTMPLRRLLEPAVHYAAEGFPLTDIVSQEHPRSGPALRRSRVAAHLHPRRRLPSTGDLFRQPDLARTLRELGEDGELFYRGRVAQAIADRLATDGFLTAADLATHEGEWGEAISTSYRGYTVYETPAPTQGLAALLGLNILEGFDVAKHPVHSAEHLHLLSRRSSSPMPIAIAGSPTPTTRRCPLRASCPRTTRRAGAAPSTRARPRPIPGATPRATPPASWSPTGRGMC